MTLKVLSVEDDDAAFYVLRLAFQECGVPIELDRAHDGEEALNLFRSSPSQPAMPKPNLILLNLNLPKRSGLEVLAALRAHPDWSSVPVVIFTSSSLDSERAKCLALGAVDYVTKPMHFEGVMQAVRQACTYAAAG